MHSEESFRERASFFWIINIRYLFIYFFLNIKILPLSTLASTVLVSSTLPRNFKINSCKLLMQYLQQISDEIFYQTGRKVIKYWIAWISWNQSFCFHQTRLSLFPYEIICFLLYLSKWILSITSCDRILVLYYYKIPCMIGKKLYWTYIFFPREIYCVNNKTICIRF